MAEVEEVALDGFREGFTARRSPLDFGDEQWAELYGLVLEDGGALRSQWPLQEVKGLDDVASVGVYHGDRQTPFVVAVLSNGDVHWREAPPEDAPSDADELDEVWYPLLDEDGNALTGGNAPFYGVRPLLNVPVDAVHLGHADGGIRSTMMLNAIGIPDTGEVWFVYEADDEGSDHQRLRAMTLGSAAMWPTRDTEEDEDTAVSPVSPKGQVAALWSGVLVLGDVEWNADPESAIGSGNNQRHRNAMWLSEPGDPLAFDPLNVLFVGDYNTRITGLLPAEQGLLVFTSSTERRGGVFILRGTPDAYVLEPLQVGVGVGEGQARWQDTATYCWVNEAGEVWQTDGQQTARLDDGVLGWDRQYEPEDGVARFGPWLLVHRDRGMYTLRAFGDQLAWTELNVYNLPGEPDMRYAFESGQTLYVPAGGRLFRFTRADIRNGVSERGEVLGEDVVQRVGTRTLATGEGLRKTFWHRFGVRATAGRRAPRAEIESVELRGGPARDPRLPVLTRPGPWDLFEPFTRFTSPSDTAAVQEIEDDLSNGGFWTEVTGSWTFDGQATTEGPGRHVAFHGNRLGENEQYASADVEGVEADHWVSVRHGVDGTETYYRFRQTDERRTIDRVTEGSSRTLASAPIGASPPFTMELVVFDSRLEAFVDGESVLQAVDTVISGGRYIGIGALGDGRSFSAVRGGTRLPENLVTWGGSLASWNSFQVEWAPGPVTLLPPPQTTPKRFQAMVRGVGASGEASAVITMRGDVRMEQVSVFFAGSILGGDSEGR